MIETADAEQIIVVRDNRGNFAELLARYDVDGTIVLTVNATDGVVFSTIALALVNFAAGLVTDNETGRYLEYAGARLLEHCGSLVCLTQNDNSTREDELPF